MSALSDLQEVMRLVGAMDAARAKWRSAADQGREEGNGVEWEAFCAASDEASLAALNFLRTHAEAMAKEARDGARYRWLAANCVKPRSVNPEMDCGFQLHFDYHTLFNEPDLGYAIDMRIRSAEEKAIDAAIGAGGSNG